MDPWTDKFQLERSVFGNLLQRGEESAFQEPDTAHADGGKLNRPELV